MIELTWREVGRFSGAPCVTACCGHLKRVLAACLSSNLKLGRPTYTGLSPPGANKRQSEIQGAA